MISSVLVEGRASSRFSIYAMHVAGVSDTNNELIRNIMKEGRVPLSELKGVIETVVGCKLAKKGRERVINCWRIGAAEIKQG